MAIPSCKLFAGVYRLASVSLAHEHFPQEYAFEARCLEEGILSAFNISLHREKLHLLREFSYPSIE